MALDISPLKSRGKRGETSARKSTGGTVGGTSGSIVANPEAANIADTAVADVVERFTRLPPEARREALAVLNELADR